MTEIVLKSEGFTKDFNAIVNRAKKPKAVLVNMGNEARNLLKRHFRDKNRQEPNKLGGKRTNYWNGVSDSVQNPVLQEKGNVNQVRISITEQTFAQKLHGGVIRAKNVDNLTIPQTAEAYGRTAETFEAETGLKLFLIVSKTGGRSGRGFAALAAKFASGGIVIEYILKAQVNQKPTPGALPDMSDGSAFTKALLARGQAVVDREATQTNSGSGGIEQ